MISGIFTICAFVGFLGVTYWAYVPRNRRRHEEAARLVLEPIDIDSAAAKHLEQEPPCCRNARSKGANPC